MGEEPDHQAVAVADPLDALFGRVSDLGERRGWQVGQLHYRAVDQFGQVIDVLVSARRDAMAVRWFFEEAIRATKVTPMEVTTRPSAGVSGRPGGAAAGGVAPHRAASQQPR